MDADAPKPGTEAAPGDDVDASDDLLGSYTDTSTHVPHHSAHGAYVDSDGHVYHYSAPAGYVDAGGHHVPTATGTYVDVDGHRHFPTCPPGCRVDEQGRHYVPSDSP